MLASAISRGRHQHPASFACYQERCRITVELRKPPRPSQSPVGARDPSFQNDGPRSKPSNSTWRLPALAVSPGHAQHLPLWSQSQRCVPSATAAAIANMFRMRAGVRSRMERYEAMRFCAVKMRRRFISIYVRRSPAVGVFYMTTQLHPIGHHRADRTLT